MRRLASSPRWAAWAFAFALLLKAAVPMLAAAAAHAQGKALAEVCTVYGVATVALDDDAGAPQPETAVSHAGDHCALGAAVAIATAPQALPVAYLVAPSLREALPVSRDPIPDQAGAWRARLEHGPPARG